MRKTAIGYQTCGSSNHLRRSRIHNLQKVESAEIEGNKSEKVSLRFRKVMLGVFFFAVKLPIYQLFLVVFG